MTPQVTNDPLNSPLPLSAFADEPVYNVKAVCRKTGITATTLRAWERRYGVPHPNRTAQGYRLYSERDVAIIVWLMQQTEADVNIAQAVQQLNHALAGAGHILVRLPATAGCATPTGLRSPTILSGELLEALTGLDERRAAQILSESLSMYTIETLLADIVQPVAHTIRRSSQQGDFPATIERFATAYIQHWLQHMLQNTPLVQPLHRAPNEPPHNVVTIGFPGEHNEIDLLMLGLLLRRAGFPVVHLGAELGPEMLEAKLDHLHPEIVVYYTDEPAHAEHLIGFDAPRREDGTPAWCVIAGNALEIAPALEEQISFEYLGADLRQIVRRLLQRRARQADYRDERAG